MMQKLLVLDLDETLVYATMAALSDHIEDFRVGPYFVYKRPGLDNFLSFCRDHFLVAVWTASSDDYASGIISSIFPDDYDLEFVWSRERCVRRFNDREYNIDWIKELKKVKKKGYLLDRVIMVDDTPAKLARNYGNLIRVKPFEGDSKDNELQLLEEYLLALKKVKNICNVEKRGWRNKYSDLPIQQN